MEIKRNKLNPLHFSSGCAKISLGEFGTILTQSLAHAVALVAKCEKNKTTENNEMKKSTLYLTRGALIAALYTVLTYLTSLFGLSSGVIQFRISEALCVLPLFMPEAVMGLFIGCILSNILTGAVFWDVVFGSIATLIAALITRALRCLPEKLKWLATLPPVISNAVIVPFVLIHAYGVTDGYFFLLLTVGIGELVCAVGLGTMLYYTLKKYNFLN